MVTPQKAPEEPIIPYEPEKCPKKRPCSRITCRYHLAVDWIDGRGNRKSVFNFPGKTLEELPETCALDVANHYGGLPMEAVGQMLNLTRERIRQIENMALRKIRPFLDSSGWNPIA